MFKKFFFFFNVQDEDILFDLICFQLLYAKNAILMHYIIIIYLSLSNIYVCRKTSVERIPFHCKKIRARKNHTAKKNQIVPTFSKEIYKNADCNQLQNTIYL